MTETDSPKPPKDPQTLYERDRASQTEQLLITRNLVGLNAAFTAVSSTLNVEEVYSIVTREMVTLMSSKACTFYEWDPDKQIAKIHSSFSHGVWDDDALRHDILKLIEYPLTNTSLINNRAVQKTLSQSSIGPKERAFMVQYGLKTLLLLPVTFQNRTFGILKVYTNEEKFYKDYELIIAGLFLKQVAISIENAQMYERAQREIQTDLKFEEHTKFDSLHDSLTALPNRALFMDRLQQAMLRNRRDPDMSFSVVYLDLDRFKNINDTYGRQAGDELLARIARMFRKSVREVDTIARFGGDEFIILLESDTTKEESENFAIRLGELLAKQINVGGHFISNAASIGIVMNSLEYQRPEEYIRDADVAMYHAKSNGRGRYEFFTEEMREGEYKQLALESDLRRAIKDNEFILHYQPIVSLANNRIMGFEALVRWLDRSSGEIYPNDFLPLAEESGLIIDLGFWVIYEACRQITKWQNVFQVDPPLSININISIKQLIHPDFIGEIKQVFEFFSLNPNALVFEISENTLSEAVIDVVKKLRDLGVRIHLDNYGRGDVTMDALRHYSFNAVKIDRSLVSKIESENGQEAPILSMIEAADKLGMEIIAEGIESIFQAQKLRKLGCHFGQGFLFQEGQNAVAMEKYIDQYFKLIK